MERFTVISMTASVNGSRTYEKVFYNYIDAHRYATKRAEKGNVFYVHILNYKNNGKTTYCEKIWVYDKMN